MQHNTTDEGNKPLAYIYSHFFFQDSAAPKELPTEHKVN